jgi:hypothetical protein
MSEGLCTTIVPAEPGWYVAEFQSNKYGIKPFFDYHPVVASAVEHGRHHVAVPVDCFIRQHHRFREGFRTESALKSPDGKYRAGVEVFDTESGALGWLDHVAAERAAHAKGEATAVPFATPTAVVRRGGKRSLPPSDNPPHRRQQSEGGQPWRRTPSCPKPSSASRESFGSSAIHSNPDRARGP